MFLGPESPPVGTIATLAVHNIIGYPELVAQTCLGELLMGWGRLVVGPYLPHLPSLSRYPTPPVALHTRYFWLRDPLTCLTALAKVPGGQRPLSLSDE